MCTGLGADFVPGRCPPRPGFCRPHHLDSLLGFPLKGPREVFRFPLRTTQQQSWAHVALSSLPARRAVGPRVSPCLIPSVFGEQMQECLTWLRKHSSAPGVHTWATQPGWRGWPEAQAKPWSRLDHGAAHELRARPRPALPRSPQRFLESAPD